MSEAVYLGIDIGTQSVRAMALSDNKVVAAAKAPLASTREAERHEQDPEDWWEAVTVCCRSVMTQLGARKSVRGVAVSGTSGTILVVDQRGRPLTSGLLYDDGRARTEAQEVQAAGASLWTELGYRMRPSWALPKLLWLTRNSDLPAGARLANQADFVTSRLAGTLLPSDSSNSLKTGYDLLRNCWPASILDRLQLGLELFPEVVRPGQRIGEVAAVAAEQTMVPPGTPIFAGMTDGCAAQIASGATSPGNWNSVIGTTLVLKGVTRDLLHDPHGIIYSHRSADGYWLPGGASSTGAGVLNRFRREDGWERLTACALATEPTKLVTYPLASQGERYPFAAADAHRFSLGQPKDILDEYRAEMQGIAFVERLAFDALGQLGATFDGPLTISGGATRNEALNQIRADVLGRELRLPSVTEGALGMAMLAAANETSLSEITRRVVRVERTIEPQRPFSQYAEQYRSLLLSLHERDWLPAQLLEVALSGARL